MLLQPDHLGLPFMRDGELWIVVSVHGRPAVSSYDDLKNLAVYGTFVTACRGGDVLPAPVFMLEAPTKEEVEVGVAEATARGYLPGDTTVASPRLRLVKSASNEGEAT